MDDFYAARTTNMAALPSSNFAPPFSQGHAPDQQLDEHDFDGSEALLQASGFRFLGLAAGEAQ